MQNRNNPCDAYEIVVAVVLDVLVIMTTCLRHDAWHVVPGSVGCSEVVLRTGAAPARCGKRSLGLRQ